MKIVVGEHEQRLVALVRHMHSIGLTMGAIVTELRALGVVRPDGSHLRLVHIWTILRT
jgi:hypothetical protein